MEETNKKNSKKIKIIIAVIIFILLIAAGIAWFIISNMDKNTPEEVFTSYINFLNNKDYEGMYSLISDSTKTTVDKDTYISRNKNIYEGIEAANIQVSNIIYNKENKTISYNMTLDTLAGSITMDNTASFTRQDDKKYYINWSSSLIFPELKEDFKIRVYSISGVRGNILDRNGKILATTNENGVREYPYGEISSHLVGYIRGISEEELAEHSGEGYTASSLIGKTGLEAAFEDRLRGKNGTGIYLVNQNEEMIKTIAETDREDGEDIKTTIDINLQKNIYNEFDGDNGFSIAMDQKTGEVLALVSTPSFDPNMFSTGFTEEEWNSLSSDKNTPMFTRYESTWAPGSSFKPVTGAIGLSTKSFTAKEDFGTSGTSWQKDSSWGDYKITTLTTYGGDANLKNALIYSDNIYFAKAALKIGSDTFAKQLLNIGFGKTLEFPILMSSSQFGTNSKFGSEVELADSGYGQGKVLVNPLHMASIYSAFANNGNMIKPHILLSEEPEYWIENAFPSEIANEIKNDLIQVVENSNGTGHEAKINGVTIAGKTGTAELKASKDEKGEELGWFNAFVVSEEDNEQLLTINMIENVENRGGSHYLLPKVRNIIRDYLE